jgi:hypothetical protein
VEFRVDKVSKYRIQGAWRSKTSARWPVFARRTRKETLDEHQWNRRHSTFGTCRQEANGNPTNWNKTSSQTTFADLPNKSLVWWPTSTWSPVNYARRTPGTVSAATKDLQTQKANGHLHRTMRRPYS